MKSIAKALFSLAFIIHSVQCYSTESLFGRKEIIEDILFMDSIIRTIHPEPFHYTPLQKYDSLKAEVLSDLPDSLSLEKIYLLTAPILASLKDGHSMMLTPYDPLVNYLKANGKVFPLDIYLSNGKIFVKSDYYQNKSFDTNTELISINNMNAASLLSTVLKLFPIELYDNLFYKSIERDFYALLFYITSLKDENIEICLKDSVTTEVYKTKLIPYALYNSNKNKANSKESEYSYHFSEDKNKVYVKLMNFLPSSNYYSFIDSLFTDLDNHSVNDMTIDIRGNSGGSSNAVDTLVSYLYADCYKLYSNVYLKISDAVKNKYLQKDSILYAVIKDKQIGNMMPETIVYSCPNRKTKVYNGKIQILVDERTYSGASSFANLMNELGRGTLSGTIGGNNTYFGDFLIFELPHTKLRFTVSTKKFIEYKANASS